MAGAELSTSRVVGQEIGTLGMKTDGNVLRDRMARWIRTCTHRSPGCPAQMPGVGGWV
jgi:hypothetical protein